MTDFTQSKQAIDKALTTQEIFNLEDEGKLLRVLRPDVLERITRCLATSRQKIEPFIVEFDGAIYFSFMSITSSEQREQAVRKIQQWQTGIDVDLNSLPRPLHQLLQPHRAISQRLLRSIMLGGIAGTIAGVLAMALSILIIAVTELIIGKALATFGDIEITAVSFVIFSVLGWMAATPLVWNRLNR